MDKAMPLDKDSSVQYGLEEYPLGGSLYVPGNGRGVKSKVRILRLVTTPTERYELLRRLRSDPQSSDIPVIILTR